MHLKAVSVPRILIADPWCPHFIYSIVTRRYNCERKYWEIYFPPCVSFLWATEMSCTVKQTIRTELNIELHCERANQCRARHYIHDPSNKPVTDHFILGRNPRVVNGPIKRFWFLPLPNPHTFYVDIREQFKNIVSMRSMAPLRKQFL